MDHAQRVLWVSDRAFRAALGQTPDAATRQRVLQAAISLRRLALPGVEDIVPAATTVTIFVHPAATDHETIEREVRRMLDFALGGTGGTPPPKAVVHPVDIPVCYDGDDFAPDLPAVAEALGLTPERVAELHSGVEYDVAFLGFAPGFAYLADLPEALRVPRLDTPRVRVPAGSVAIAGRYTGIYPASTPGGWRLIGRTPMRMFDALRERPSLLGPGDRVRFIRISRDRFEAGG